MSYTNPQHALPPVAGRFDRDDDSLHWATDDWGKLTHDRPIAVLRPGSVEDIRTIISFGKSWEFPVVPRGEGHSSAGQAQAPDGIVVDMGMFQDIHEITRDRVVVDAGVRWSRVLNATLPHGLAPPVLTDYLDISVGGTLSVGGVGGATQHHGFQTDNVLELDVLTPDGRRMTCSSSSDAEVFHRVLAGCGDHGYILRATLRLVPAESRVRWRHLYYPDVRRLLHDQRLALRDGRFDHLEGQAQLDDTGAWCYLIEAATFYTDREPTDELLLADLSHQRGTEEVLDTSYYEFHNRLAVSESFLRERGLWQGPHPWLNLFLPDSTADTFVERVMSELGADDIGEAGVVLIYPFPTATRTPQLRLPDERSAFLFALLRNSPGKNSPVDLREMVSGNQELRDRAIAAGGMSYLD